MRLVDIREKFDHQSQKIIQAYNYERHYERFKQDDKTDTISGKLFKGIIDKSKLNLKG